jgi:hypothetical protein
VTANAARAGQGDWRTSIGLRVLFAIILVAAAGYVFWYHGHYYVWPGQPAGSKISWCGQDYQAGKKALSSKEINAGSPSTLHGVAAYPPLGSPRQQVFAQAGLNHCPSVVYLETTPGQFTAYGLVGGT